MGPANFGALGGVLLALGVSVLTSCTESATAPAGDTGAATDTWLVPDTGAADATDSSGSDTLAPDTADTATADAGDGSEPDDVMDAADTLSASDTAPGPNAHLARPLVDDEADDDDDREPLPGTPFTSAAFVSAPPCSRRSYGLVKDCYNEVHPPAPTLVRSLARANLAPAADTLPNAVKVPTDGSVDHRGKIQALPAARTSADGRISVAGGCDGCESLQFRIFRPENLGHDTTVVDSRHLVHALRNDPYNWIGSLQSRFILWDPSTSALTPQSTDANGNLHLPDVLQSTLCEASSDRVSIAHEGANVTAELLPDNPRTCRARFGESDALETGDCYDLTLLTGVHAKIGQSRWELRSVDLTLFVRGPKRVDTGETGFPEGATNSIWAYPRDPSGATTSEGLQTLPPFVRFELARAFTQNPDGTKLLGCPDANGQDLTGTSWWECFNPGKLPNAAKFAAQIRGTNGRCFDAQGNRRPNAPGFCEYFFRQHQASNVTVDEDEDGVLGNGRPWNGKASGCANDPACRRDGSMFESITTGDGRLLILNLRGVFYAYNTLGACRADGFTSFAPISWLPGDPAVNTRYDLARVTGGRPFRDALGQPIPFGKKNPGAYPWVDRRGRNLFYAAQNLARDGWFAREAHFHDYTGAPTGTIALANPAAPPNASQRPVLNPDHGPGSQYVLLGSWTQGKAVVLDELNVADFSGGESIANMPANSVGPHTAYTMSLYSGPGGEIRFQSKGVQSVNSFEHVLGMYDALRPTLPFDVVWSMQTDVMRNVELAFDPYLNPRAVVVAHMNAPLDMRQTPVDSAGLPTQTAFVQDGFVAMGKVDASVRYGETADFRFKVSPRLQNAASVDPAAIDGAALPPSFLTVRGGARVEPVGLGGVLGKGLYLDGYNDYVELPIPAQPGLADAYVGLWLDPRDEDLGVRPRTILVFADGSFIGLRRPAPDELELVFHNAADRSLRALPVTGLITVGRWAHLGVAVRGGKDDREMDVRVDGTLLGTLDFDRSLTEGRGFELVTSEWGPVSTSYLGDPGPALANSSGLARRSWLGWVDELRIYAVSAAEQRHPSFGELACNEALGTMVDVGVRTPETAHPALDALRAKRARYPEGPTAMCEQLVLAPRPDESLQAAMLPRQRGLTLCAERVHKNPREEADLAARCLRTASLELPTMTWDAPRPDSSTTTFCLTCHHDESGVAGLRADVLYEVPGLARWLDPRRQPLQVPARLGGLRQGAFGAAGLNEADPIDRYFDRLPYWAPQTQ